MQFAAEEGAGGQDDPRRANPQSALGNDAAHAVAFHEQVIDSLLKQFQPRLGLDDAADGVAVQHAVCLGARRAHRGALAPIEHAELNARGIGGPGHGTAQGVDLAH